MDNYGFGRSKEELVAKDLEKYNISDIHLTEASRGPFDVFGKFSDGQYIFVQVKASRESVATPVATNDDKSKLILMAKEYGAQAYIAYVVGENIEYEKLV